MAETRRGGIDQYLPNTTPIKSSKDGLRSLGISDLQDLWDEISQSAKFPRKLTDGQRRADL